MEGMKKGLKKAEKIVMKEALKTIWGDTREYIVEGAVIKCNKSKMKVLKKIHPVPKPFIIGMDYLFVVTEEDNIPDFGTCKDDENQCIPNPGSNVWQNTSNGKPIVNGKNVLLIFSEIECEKGGKIEFETTGQPGYHAFSPFGMEWLKKLEVAGGIWEEKYGWPYDDGYGNSTIGFGTCYYYYYDEIEGCVKEISILDEKFPYSFPITKEEAEMILMHNIKYKYGKAVNDKVTVPLTQYQFEALVGNVYNNQDNSNPLLTVVNKNPDDFYGIAAKFMENETDLISRRIQELVRYFGGSDLKMEQRLKNEGLLDPNWSWP